MTYMFKLASAHPMRTPPLNIALLIDSPTVPVWAVEAIRRVAAEGHARWSVVLLHREPARQASSVQRARQDGGSALAAAYVRLDQIVSPAERDPLAPRSIDEVLPGVPQLDAGELGIDAGESPLLDVIVSFSAQPPNQPLLAAAKAGVWTFAAGEDSDSAWSRFPGLREVVDDVDVNRVSLQMRSSANQSYTLVEICTAVDRLSAARNRANMYWPAVSLLPRQLARLQRLGLEPFQAEAEGRTFAAPVAEPIPQPALTGGKLVAGLARLTKRRLRRKWTKQLYRDQWFLLSHFDSRESAANRTAVEVQGEAELAVPGSARLAEPTKFQPIIPPIDRFWADPHVVCRNGKPYVFFEEYLYAIGKAHISVMEFDDRGRWQTPRPVIEQAYHLSYPFVFHWQGQWFMIPETSGNRTLEVYRCDEFPHRWSLYKVLWRNVNAYDATLLEHAGHWWMFVTLVENAGASSSDELFLFHADHPLSDHWLPHPLNPIVSDVRRARPAGPLFMRDGQLYRPAQDSSRTYGYGIRVHRIDELSPTRYHETEVSRIEPLADRGWLATHTLSSAGGLTMLDAQHRRSKFSRDEKVRLRKTAETPRRGEEAMPIDQH